MYRLYHLLSSLLTYNGTKHLYMVDYTLEIYASHWEIFHVYVCVFEFFHLDVSNNMRGKWGLTK